MYLYSLIKSQKIRPNTNFLYLIFFFFFQKRSIRKNELLRSSKKPATSGVENKYFDKSQKMCWYRSDKDIISFWEIKKSDAQKLQGCVISYKSIPFFRAKIAVKKKRQKNRISISDSENIPNDISLSRYCILVA